MINTSNLILKDPQISARGAKSCPILNAQGNKVFFNLGSKSEPVSSPFGATSFNDEVTSRKTIEFNLTEGRRSSSKGLTNGPSVISRSTLRGYSKRSLHLLRFVRAIAAQ